MTIDDQLFDAVRDGDIDTLSALLDRHPEKLAVRNQPYDATLLHVAAANGRLRAVDLLLARGLDVNVRERGDNTCAMHWAAAHGHLDVVARLADAGGDVVGQGDDHQLDVIGWATCWDPCQSDVARLLVSRGARHHIFSAVAMNLADEVRQIVANDRSALNRRLSRSDGHQMPLHLAVRKNLPEMVSLLVQLGADPLAVEGEGFTAAAYATTKDVDRPVMEAIARLTSAELVSADRGHRLAAVGMLDLIAALCVRDWTTAERLLRENPALIGPGGKAVGALHLMAKRNDAMAMTWLLEHGAEPNARWGHWNAEVTPLHLAAMQGHVEIVRLLVRAGADPSIRDTAHDSDPLGWARFLKRSDVVRLLENAGRAS
jgi:ankyrin repeat protein